MSMSAFFLSFKLAWEKRTDRVTNSQDAIFLWHALFSQSLRRRLLKRHRYLLRLKGASMHRMGVLQNRTQLFGIERLMQAQGMSDAIEGIMMRSQQTESTIIGPVHDALHFFIDDGRRLLAILT